MGGTWLALLLLLAPAAPAKAESGDDRLWADCSHEGDVARDRSIAACTSLIRSGRVHGKPLGTAYYNRAISYSSRGEKGFAVADYSEAIRLDPKDSDAFVNRGIAYLDLGEHQRALADLEEAIRLDPRKESAWSARGDVYVEMGDLARAVSAYGEVIRLNPRDSDAYYNRGLSLRQLGKDDAALADYDQSIRLNPEFSDVHNNRGYVYFRRGDLVRAIADYKQAVALKPANVEAQANLCRAMLLQGEDLDRARTACDSALAITDDLDTRVWRGAIAYRQGRFQQAWADFDAAARLDPDSGLALYGRALAAKQLGRNAEAEPDFTAAIARRPGVAAEFGNYGIRH